MPRMSNMVSTLGAQQDPCLRVNDACVVILLTTAMRRTTNNGKPIKVQPARYATQGLHNETDRLRWYERSLRLWNADVSQRHAVVVVDSAAGRLQSSTKFPHLESVVFRHTNDEDLRVCGNRFARGTTIRSMGEHELVGIETAMQNSSRINSVRTTHILKITGRYYVPGLAGYLQNLTRDHWLIERSSPFAHTECRIMGCRKGDFCKHIFRCPYNMFGHCERSQKNRFAGAARVKTSEHTSMRNGVSSTLRLPSMAVAFTLMGSNAESVDII